MDEHQLTRRKYNRGRLLATEKVWVWGAIDITTHQIIIKRLPDQRAQSLMALTAAHIRPGSKVFTDGAYKDRENDFLTLGMQMHWWVNHSEGTYAEQVDNPITGGMKQNFNRIILIYYLFRRRNCNNKSH